MTTRLSSRQTRAAIERLGIERPLITAFAVADDARRVRYSMHEHSRHQLLVASAGSFWVETRDRLHMCDATVGLWIPARCRHATTMNVSGTLSIFFSPGRYASPVRGASPVTMTPLLRHMAVAAVEEMPSVAPAVRRQFFDVLFALVMRGRRADAGVALPNPADPRLASAVAHLLDHLDTVTVPELARAAASSERTLRRRFLTELRLTPEHYIRRARLIRAAHILAGDRRASILDVALLVGYSNHSAFTAAFRRMFGTPPSAIRRTGTPVEA
ncbi:MAG: helix-turn-helix domain-containing protein [Vicinamibacterales bacterium]